MIYEVSIPIAFVAGLVSFFAPCVVPLLPAYIAYITGVSVTELQKNNFDTYRKKIFISGIFYVIGFSLIFVIMGTAAASVSGYFFHNRSTIQQIGGLIIIIMGIHFSGIFRFNVLSKSKYIHLPKWSEKLGYLRSFLLGIIFAAVWSPCVGVVYGSILALAALTGTAVQGAFLLFIYSLGISIPFLLVSMTLAVSPKYLKIIEKYFDKIALVSGVLLVILGILLITDAFGDLNNWLLWFVN